MSVSKESWHKEVASFEKQKDLLFHQYSRGLITAEEFATKMLRLWKGEKGEGGLLDVAPNGDLIITPEWIYTHTNFFKEVTAWTERWERITRGVNVYYLNPGNLATDVLADRDLYSASDVWDVYALMETAPEVGESVRESYHRNPPPPGQSWRTEQEFERWLQKTLETTKVLVEKADRHFSEDPQIQETGPRG